MPPKAKPLSEAQVQEIRDAANYTKVAQAQGISHRRARAIRQAATLEEARALGRGGTRGQLRGAASSVSEGGELVTVASPKPAAVVFSLGQTLIEVDPQAFYEAYLIYLDLKDRGMITTDGFGEVIKDALIFAWRALVLKPDPLWRAAST